MLLLQYSIQLYHYSDQDPEELHHWGMLADDLLCMYYFINSTSECSLNANYF